MRLLLAAVTVGLVVLAAETVVLRRASAGQKSDAKKAGSPNKSAGENASGGQAFKRRSGRVRVVDHCLVDDDGPFLGLGVSYFTALWRAKHDRPRLEADLAFFLGDNWRVYIDGSPSCRSSSELYVYVPRRLVV